MSTLKKKRAAYGAAFGIVLFFLIGITLQLNSQPLQQYARAQTPTIIFNPNQKQTTFFETPPPDTPVPTAVPIPTSRPRVTGTQVTQPTQPPQAPTTLSGFPTAPMSQPTEPPQSGNQCVPDSIITNNCVCEDTHHPGQEVINGLCGGYLYVGFPGSNSYNRYRVPGTFFDSVLSLDEFNTAMASGCQKYCVKYDKPVIYLYPDEPTYVSVRLDIPGTVIESIPHYPEGGWSNVLAYPSGQLEYNGESYPNLFYETNVGDLVPRAKRGEFIRRAELQADLDNMITKFGLIGAEKTEFLEYWVPRLQHIEKPYFLARPLTLTEKNIVDTVIIQPKPDTFIHLLIQFYPSDTVYPVEKIRYPTSIPVRRGFTAVEWGGAVMNEGL